MILEVAILQVKPGMTQDFEQNFKLASTIISKMEGYISHELQKCLEDPNKYVLLVKWEKMENYIIGFRKSEQYIEWKELLHHFYDPFPVVEHFEKIY